MIGYLAVVALFLLAPPPVEPTPSVPPDVFRASFASALAGELTIPTDVKRVARGYRYVFVGGFMNEGMTEYFKQNARELRAVGVPRQAIHYIYPSSHETIEGNAAAVRARFQEFAARGPEKMVVIAHSRGACDTLAFALSHAQFVSDHIQALFLIQGPFGGTGLVFRRKYIVHAVGVKRSWPHSAIRLAWPVRGSCRRKTGTRSAGRL